MLYFYWLNLIIKVKLIIVIYWEHDINGRYILIQIKYIYINVLSQQQLIKYHLIPQKYFLTFGRKCIKVAVYTKTLKFIFISAFQDAKALEPIVLELDLSNIDQMETFVQKVYDMCGHIDILINNGGISHRGSILHTKIDVDKQIMSINYFGSVALTKGLFYNV